LLALLLAAAAIAACGGSSNDESAATPTSTPTPTETPTPSAAKKPKVKVPSGKPPKRLVKIDLRKGDGLQAQKGETVTVQYVGVDYKTHKQFDASWDRGQPFSFPLGQGQVIKGWDKGVVGMRTGGRRELIIPPKLAYGAQGQPPTIGPNATLVFVIDLLSVQ
jgi:peptidylprolyl isomerase